MKMFQLLKSMQSLEHSNQALTLNLTTSQKTVGTLEIQNNELSERLNKSEKELSESRSKVSTLEITLVESNKSYERQLESERFTIARFDLQLSSLQHANEELNSFIKKHAIRQK